MKKLHLLLVGMLALSVSLFTSCGEDPIEEEVAPSINWTNYDGKDFSVLANEEVKFEFELVEETNEIASVEVYYTISSKDFYVYKSADSSKAPKNGDKIIITESFADAGVYPFTFVVTDKEDLKLEKTINVTVDAALTNQGKFTLGAGANSAGSFYSVETGGVYKKDSAVANFSKINIVYNYLAADGGAQIYSPTESSALTGKATTETKFIKSTLNFTTVTPAELNGVTPTETRIKNLANGDVIVFQIKDGKKGIILIDNIVENADGTASITVKVK